MAIVWGPVKNSCSIGLEWQPLPAVTPTTTKIRVQLRVYFRANVRMYDYNNTASWSGGLGSGSVGLGVDSLVGPGTKVLRTIQADITLTNSRQTITQAYTQANVEYTGNLTASASISIPAKAQGVPDNPTSFTISNASGIHTLAWTNVNAANPAKPYGNLEVQRAEGDGSTPFILVATLPPTATSYTDLGTRSNNRYRWRVRATNSSSVSGWVYTPAGGAWVATQPVAPAMGAAVKQPSNDIVISWANVTRWQTGVEVWASQNGGTYALLTTVTGAAVTSYNHATPNPAVTWRYRLRAVYDNPAGMTDTVSGYSLESNLVALAVKPGRTLLTYPTDGMLFDATTTTRFTWEHASLDGSAQSQAFVWYKIAPFGTTDWSGITALGSTITGSDQFWDRLPTPADVGKVMQWAVRTKGAHPDWSEYSFISQVLLSQPPSVTILTPTSGATLPGSEVLVEWSVASPTSSVQDGAVVELRDGAGSTVIRAWQIAGNVKTQKVTGLEDATSYQLWVTAVCGGLRSTPAVANISASYAKPMAPEVEAEYDAQLGSVLLKIVNPAPVGAAIPAISNRVYDQDGRLVAEVDPDTSVQDYIPLLRGARYYVQAWSAAPSMTETEVFPDQTPNLLLGMGLHLNSGPEYSVHAVSRGGGASFTESAVGDVSVERFEGDVLDSATFGPGSPRRFTVSTSPVFFTMPDASPEDFRAVVNEKMTACLRRPDMRIYGAISDLQITSTNELFGEVSFTFTETGGRDR